MKKKYIIVGDNNFWYANTDEITEEELEKAITEVKSNLKKGVYEDNSADVLFVFEAKEIKRIKL